MEKFKPYLPYIILALAGIGLFMFWDYALEIILGLFGLGMAAASGKKQQAKDMQAIADEHEALMDDAVADAVIQQKHADMLRQDALDIAEDITPMPVQPAKGKTRRKFISS